MNASTIVAGALAAVVVAIAVVVLMRLWWYRDFIKGRPAHRHREPRPPKPLTVEQQRARDVARINRGECPDCAEKALLEGPSGGMGMNIACDKCHSEFSVGFGFGTGAWTLQRMGKLTASRAGVYGIKPDELNAN